MAQQAVEQPVEKPKKPEWSCKIETPPADSKGYTVGELFEMTCEGESLSFQEPLQIVMPEQLQYTLVYLKTLSQSDNKVQFQATSYRVGQFKYPFLHIQDASGVGFISQPLELNTSSVIDPQKPPQAPYGPIQPMSLAWPYWISFAVLIFLAVLLSWFFIFLRQRYQQKNLEKNIRKFQSPMGSYHQFSKDLRMLKRGVVFSSHHVWSESQTQNFLSKLDEIFRMFILREYIIPALNWSPSKIARDVAKKSRRNYSQFKAPFLKALKELERAKGNMSKVTAQDCEQLCKICALAVDTMWKHRKEDKP